jgi:hypothetical protein
MIYLTSKLLINFLILATFYLSLNGKIILEEGKFEIRYDLRLTNHYQWHRVTNKECHVKCLNDFANNCVAIAYKNYENNCYLYNENFGSRTESGWVSQFLPPKHASVYSSTRLANHYSYIWSNSAYECYLRCLESSRCQAITFEEHSTSGTSLGCLFYDETRIAGTQSNWYSLMIFRPAKCPVLETTTSTSTSRLSTTTYTTAAKHTTVSKKIKIFNSTTKPNLGSKLPPNELNGAYLESLGYTNQLVTSIDMPNLNFVSVDPKAFSNYSRLIEIDLSNNKLSSLDQSTFANLHNLTRLFLGEMLL